MTAEMDVQSEVSKGGEDLNVNVSVIGNGISKDDGDGSYVFVTGSDAGPSEESDLTNGHCSVNGGDNVPLKLEGEVEESVVVDDARSQLLSLTEESTQSSDPEIAVEKSHLGSHEEPQLAEEVAVQDASRDLVQDSEHELLTTQADSKLEKEIVSDLELKDNGDGVPACDAHDNASGSTAEQNGSSESDRALAADPVGVELELDTQVVNGSVSHENGDGLPTHDVQERFSGPLVTKHLVDTAGSCERNGQNLADNVDVQRSISDPIAEKINGSCDKNSQVSAANFDIQESAVEHVAEDLNGSCGQISTVNGDVQESAVEHVAEDINSSCEENGQISTAIGDVQESAVVHVAEDTNGSCEKNGQISTAKGDVQESTVQHIAEDINGSCEENGQISTANGDVQESVLNPIAGMINATREENILAANLDVEESALEPIAEKFNGPCEDMAADDVQEMSDPITERINDSCEENGQMDIVEVQKQVNESLTVHAHAESISEPIIINHLADTSEVNGSCEKMEVLAASVEIREQLEPQDVSGPISDEIMDDLPIVHAHQENTSEPIVTDDLVITAQEGGSSEKASVYKTVSVGNGENIATVSDGDRTVCVESGDLSPKEEDSACTIDDATPENDEKNNKNLISCPAEHSTSEVEAERAPIEAETFSSFAANDVISEPDSKSEIEAQTNPVMDDALLGGPANDAVSKPSPKSETEAETGPMIEHVLTGSPSCDAMLEPNVKSDIESGNVPIVDDTQSSCLTNAISEPISGLKCESEISPVVDDTLSSVPADGSIHEPKTISDSTDCQKTVDIVDATLSNLEAECAIAYDSGKPMLQENGSVEDAATLPATLPDSSGTDVSSTITEDRPGSEDQSISAESSGGAFADDASESTLVNGTDGVNRSEASTSWQEVPTIVSLEEQDKVVEVEKRPFYFLIRNPRNDDENLKEQIKLAQLHVEEKTEARDAIRSKMQMQRATCKEYKIKFEAAISEERAAQDLFKSKRQEMDSVQFKINKVKDALSVEEMANTIRHMEHTMAHETLPLKEEKQYIRDIKQLKQQRDQLSFSLGKQDEVQQALDQKVHIEERIKDLRSEMDQLKSNVRKAQEVTQAAKKIYNAENDLLYELQKQFEAADATRQEAYVHLQSLKKQNYEKTKHFWRYKKDAKAANDLAVSGDKEQLQHLCITQVETFMELWNTDAEFRKEYIKCNTRSTLRRLRTLDGRSLGPDEEPAVIPDIVRVTRHNMAAAAVASAPEPIKRVTIVESEQPNDKSLALKIVKQNHEIAKTEKPVKVASSGIGKAAITFSGRKEIEEERVEEPKPTKEETELARKEEELRKEEAAAKLREQRRLEEKAKAKEAMERKKRTAEKSQARAAIKAQKEAEEKEKERERRVRKKERKKSSATKATNGIIEGEPASELISETKVETPAESEATEKPVTVRKRSQKVPQFTKQTKVKSIPLPLRNRSKRRMQPWMWVLITIVAVLGIFLLGNGGSFSFKSLLDKFH